MKASFDLPVSIALVVALVSPAMAASGPSLTSSISNLQFNAIDITPGDGNAATYQLSNQSISFTNSLDNYKTGNYNYYSKTLVPGEATSSTFVDGPFNTSQHTSGAVGDAHSSMIWNRDISLANVNARLLNTYTYTASLTLSAGSAIVVSGHLEQRFVSAGFDTENEVISSFDGFLIPENRSANGSAAILSDYFYRRDAAQDWDETSDFGLTLTNNGATDMTIDVQMYLYASMNVTRPLAPAGLDTISPVPEPASYAMLGAGLALLAGMGRRHARRA